jgi:hypothetical protein
MPKAVRRHQQKGRACDERVLIAYDFGNDDQEGASYSQGGGRVCPPRREYIEQAKNPWRRPALLQARQQGSLRSTRPR